MTRDVDSSSLQEQVIIILRRASHPYTHACTGKMNIRVSLHRSQALSNSKPSISKTFITKKFEASFHSSSHKGCQSELAKVKVNEVLAQGNNVFLPRVQYPVVQAGLLTTWPWPSRTLDHLSMNPVPSNPRMTLDQNALLTCSGITWTNQNAKKIIRMTYIFQRKDMRLYQAQYRPPYQQTTPGYMNR